MINNTLARRRFLARSAATVVGGMTLAGRSSASQRALGANDRIRLALIGSGGRGRSMLIEVAALQKESNSNAEVMGICDLWRMAREAGVADVQKLTGRTPETFSRHAEVLERKDIDGVIVATPDFWHVPVLLDALKAGKDVYVEKPLAWSLEEAKAGRDAVKASDRVVQVGTQGRSSTARVAAREFIRAGRLGVVTTAEGGFNDCGPRWRREDLCAQVKQRDFDWSFYLRDREPRSFDPRLVAEWRLWWDFSTGPSGLLGSHLYDALQFVMDAPLPGSAVAHGGRYLYKDGRETPDTFMTLIEYPRQLLFRYMTRLGNSTGQGLQIFGTRGTLDPDAAQFSGAGGAPADRLAEEPSTLEFEPQGRYAHMKNFLDCMRSRKEPVASIETGFQHTVTVLLTNAALKSGRRMQYDAQREKIVPAEGPGLE